MPIRRGLDLTSHHHMYITEDYVYSCGYVGIARNVVVALCDGLRAE